jgi:hypothetical protein
VVKRAYLDQALRFHPDRQHDQPEAAQARAAFRMREVNQAWAVLRSPATRAAYDDQLRAVAPAASVAGANPHPGPSSARAAHGSAATTTRPRPGDPRPEPQVADLDRDDGRRPPPRRSSPWRTFAPVIIGGLVLLTVLVVTAYAQDDTPTVGVRTVEQFAVGTCVVVGFGPALANEVPAEQAREAVVPVPCGDPGARRIVGRVPFPKPCPRGSTAQLMAETKDSLCLQ